MYIDLLTKIKNAQAVGKKTVKVRFTRMDNSVLELPQVCLRGRLCLAPATVFYGCLDVDTSFSSHAQHGSMLSWAGCRCEGMLEKV